MSGIANEESLGQLAALLSSGLDSLSRDQTLSFQQYTKIVLIEDGYVFWVATGISFTANGSLHFATDRVQEEDQTIGVNTIVFTSEEEVTQFNVADPQTMLIGLWTPSGYSPVKIAFSKRGAFYREASLWHYSGIAVYPALSSQIVGSMSDLPTEPIVSNSLPIWLSLTTIGLGTVPVYPSFLVPDNAVPPYIVAHIVPEETKAVQPFPVFEWPGNPDPLTALQPMASNQLMRDIVRLTMYGLTNTQAISYLAMLMNYSLDTDNFGFMSMASIQDDKRTQVEIAAIAMKKTLELEVSYYQSTSDATARRLILESLVTTQTA